MFAKLNNLEKSLLDNRQRRMKNHIFFFKYMDLFHHIDLRSTSAFKFFFCILRKIGIFNDIRRHCANVCPPSWKTCIKLKSATHSCDSMKLISCKLRVGNDSELKNVWGSTVLQLQAIITI